MFRLRAVQVILSLTLLGCMTLPTGHSLSGALAADGSDTVRLVNPIGAGADAQGSLYVLEETPEAVIDKLSPQGKQLAQWPVTVLPPGPTNAPLAVDRAGTVYIAYNARRSGHIVGAIARYSSTGKPLKTWTDSRWLNPLALAARGSGGLALVVTGWTARRNISATLVSVGPSGRTAGIRALTTLGHDFLKVTAVAATRQGTIYVTGFVGSCSRGCQGSGPGVIFRLVSVRAKRISSWVYPGQGIAQGAGLVVGAQGAIVTAGGASLTQISATGKVMARWGGSGCAPLKFRLISSLTSGRGNTLYVLDSGNRNVQTLTTGGQWIATWGGCPSTTPPTPFPPTPKPGSLDAGA